MQEPRRPQILFLDAYDSFSNNIVSLLTTLLHADVHVLPIDAPLSPQALRLQLARYDAVVCGPGPGSPSCPADTGLMKYIWETDSANEGQAAANGFSGVNGVVRGIVPALGICLGFQSLVAAHGGRIRRLKSGGLHGMVREVEHVGMQDSGTSIDSSIFSSIPSFCATLYHSLGADIGQDDMSPHTWSTPSKWQPTTQCPHLVPLAWVEESRASSAKMGGSERILMGVRHSTLPFWGLQYHPESVCTDVHSQQVLVNWFREALSWNQQHGRVPPPESQPRINESVHPLARQAIRPSLLSLRPSILGQDTTNGTTKGTNGTNGTVRQHLRVVQAGEQSVLSRCIPLPAQVQVPDIVETLEERGKSLSPNSEPEHIILDSSTASVTSEDDTVDTDATRGRHSIVAVNLNEALRIEYRTGSNFVTVRLPSEKSGHVEQVQLENRSVWQFLAEFHDARKLSKVRAESSSAVPFLGGFMGYVTYEQGLSDIGVALPRGTLERGHERPDICFAWVTQSIVVDHTRNQLHVQHLGVHVNPDWVDGVVEKLQASPLWQGNGHTHSHNVHLPAQSNESAANNAVKHQPGPQVSICTPAADEYEEKVRCCQEHIAAGDSYELCLTDQTTICVSNSESASPLPPSWDYYRTLRKRNPAPFASYLRLGGATLISSSPERFVSFEVHDGSTVCSMRPMKGTVRRSAKVATLAQAEKVLHIPKEEAENLMIVDLVRHDLYGVCGAGRVEVPRLLQVEPYGHVFQMVSVVEGYLQEGKDESSQGRYTGLDVLAASLPPGSMTGAPKKRSCEILCQIEQSCERSLYSGVVGYMCVTGRGDWSVTIRSLFRWDDETVVNGNTDKDRQEVWHIGAGGAVTIQSTAEGERDEMFTKLSRPLGIFKD